MQTYWDLVSYLPDFMYFINVNILGSGNLLTRF